MRCALFVILGLLAAGCASGPAARPPIIDVHLHAQSAAQRGPPPVAACPHGGEHAPHVLTGASYFDVAWEAAKHPACPEPLWSPMTDDELMQRTLEVLERRNILAVTSGLPELVDKWKAAGKERIIPALMFWISPQAPDVDTVRQWLEAKRFSVFGEVTNQLVGVSPDDPRFDDYLAVAEELDVPVAIHMATAPVAAPYTGLSDFRASLGSPFLLEDPLRRHPRLRVYIMHAGAPLLDEMIAVMSAHPQVHVDVGVIDWRWPREQFYRYLRGLVEAGFGKRIMFGSDQTIWPDAIELAIESIEQAPFLSEQQKRDILYNNAARFLRLGQKTE